MNKRLDTKIYNVYSRHDCLLLITGICGDALSYYSFKTNLTHKIHIKTFDEWVNQQLLFNKLKIIGNKK